LPVMLFSPAKFRCRRFGQRFRWESVPGEFDSWPFHRQDISVLFLYYSGISH
jgi:hypothetical protein